CRDYAVVELRITPGGHPVVIGIEVAAALEAGAALEIAAAAAGLPYGELIGRIVNIARERYRPAQSPGAGLPVPAMDDGKNRGHLVAG
ncbi:MAG: D-alanine--D-alanine ligase, partial [Dehalococcoidia bacterium]|nr:D-alanine--D-alanine ligase [Dehalococcoidia bacterium]